jgi:ribosomal protein S18 acetylase RimI-like enzyme
VEPLDNPVWHALRGPQANLAEGSGGARRYRPEYAPFSALDDPADPSAWQELAAVVGSGGVALLLHDVDPGTGWQRLQSFAAHQMVLAGDRAADATGRHAVEALTGDDEPEMTALVGAAEPGPWLPRTHELGEFLGIRVDGRLVAMVGQRMRLPDAIEISAVCTDPGHRGRGYAVALVGAMDDRIRDAGRRPFLHVVTDNAAALRVYERLGFRVRVTMHAAAYRAPTT